jgi:indolepyruvate ferredoxin oxidoreductase beta subunit
MTLPERPVTILIAALGGEGGGVLADWIITAATTRDYPVQSTSIPGVAQRTGATTYYVEIYPAKLSDLEGRRPVMTLTPAPSYVDIMVASELLEAARAMQNGYVTPDRTTLIASSHRIYTVAEKMQMGDGRFDSEVVLKAAKTLAKRAVLFDMQALAQEAGTVISAVMFGALAGSGALPLSRGECEAAVRAGGKGAEASLRGFAAGFEAAAAESAARAPSGEKRPRASPEVKLRPIFPAETQAMLREGASRCIDFQDQRYAILYFDRLEPIANLDHAIDGYKLTVETGRFLALWMCYEDVIRVADLKTRRSRFERIREEVQAGPGEPVRVTEFLKPGLEEFAAVMPRLVASPLKWLARITGLAGKLNVGMHVRTTSVSGFLLLRALASLRPLRPLTSRWKEEQALIGRWLTAVTAAAKHHSGLALEIALCARLIKGYGETHARGKSSFLRILETLVEGEVINDPEARAKAIRAARESALADPEGRKLEQSLEAQGIAPQPPRPKPVKFMRRPKSESKKAA